MVSTWVSCHGMHHDHSAHGHARTERFGALLNSRPSCELIVSHQASQVQQLAFQFLNSDRFGTMRGARPREREREGLQKGKVKEGERGMPREREREKLRSQITREGKGALQPWVNLSSTRQGAGTLASVSAGCTLVIVQDDDCTMLMLTSPMSGCRSTTRHRKSAGHRYICIPSCTANRPCRRSR